MSTFVPSLELLPVYEDIRVQLDEAYCRVMSSGRYLLGTEMEDFEDEYATYRG